MVYYKAINAMENRKSRGVEGSRAIRGIQYGAEKGTYVHVQQGRAGTEVLIKRKL